MALQIEKALRCSPKKTPTPSSVKQSDSHHFERLLNILSFNHPNIFICLVLNCYTLSVPKESIPLHTCSTHNSHFTNDCFCLFLLSQRSDVFLGYFWKQRTILFPPALAAVLLLHLSLVLKEILQVCSELLLCTGSFLFCRFS